MNSWSEGSVTANGIRLHYHRTGGSKPPVVLAHGITDNGLCWTRLARALEDEFDLIMVDARGHGQSDKPESGYSPHDHADDLAGVIQALGLDRPALIGHSMGGASVAVMAYSYPHLASRLILEDPGWRPREWMLDQAESNRRRQEWAETIAQRKHLSTEALIAQGRETNPTWHDDEFPAWAEAKMQVSPNVIQFVGAPAKYWWEIVPELQCPVLVLTGDKIPGALITPEMAEEINALNPRIEIVRLAGAGHNVRREAFDDYVRHVRRFLHATAVEQ